MQVQNGGFSTFYWPRFNRGRAHFFEANAGFATNNANRVVNFGVNYTNYDPQYGSAMIDYQVTTIDSLSLVNSSGVGTTVLRDSVWMDREGVWSDQKVISIKGESPTAEFQLSDNWGFFQR